MMYSESLTVNQMLLYNFKSLFRIIKFLTLSLIRSKKISTCFDITEAHNVPSAWFLYQSPLSVHILYIIQSDMEMEK